MRILHTADWHLGLDLHKMSLIDEQIFFCSQLRDIVLKEHIDVVLVCGDVYDTTLASKEAIEVYNTIMTMLCIELKVEVIVIAGNHDSPTRLSTCSQLLAPMGLHVIGKIEGKVKGIKIQDCVFYPIPFFHCEQVHQAYGTACANQEEGFRIILQDIKEEDAIGLQHIVLAHTFAAGASVCESDRFANVGGSDLVHSDVFREFDYVALGHLHRHQKVGDHAYYSGSPIAYSFSEAGQEKKVLIYDSESKLMTTRVIEAFHHLHVLHGSFAILKEKAQSTIPNAQDYFKIEVEDCIITYDMLNYFREYYPNLLALHGVSFSEHDQKITLQSKDIDMLSDLDIVKQFFLDFYQKELDDEEQQFFIDASNLLEDEMNAA